MAEANDALINKANMIVVTDKLAAIYAALEPALSTATTGCQALAEDILSEIMGITDPDEYYVEADLLAPARNLGSGLATAAVMSSLPQSFLSSLNSHCALRGSAEDATVISVDSFASYWNADTFASMLLGPSFQSLWYDVNGSYLSAGNVYAPAIKQGATYTNGMGKWSQAGGFVDGDAVDATKYMGLRPVLKVTTQLECTPGETMTIVVTGTGYDENGAVVEAAWTYESAGATLAVDEYELTDLGGEGADETIWIRNVAASAGIAITVSGSGSMSAGVCYVEGHAPDGRSDT